MPLRSPEHRSIIDKLLWSFLPKRLLEKSDEGVSVSVPGLPGCWSQGKDELEALENIRAAIGEYLEVVAEQLYQELIPSMQTRWEV